MGIREEKGIQIRKEVKLLLFADTWYYTQKNPKDTIRKLLELTSEFSKVAGYKINTQKSLAFLYINNENSEIKESLPVTITTKKNKISRNKLTEEDKRTAHRKL